VVLHLQDALAFKSGWVGRGGAVACAQDVASEIDSDMERRDLNGPQASPVQPRSWLMPHQLQDRAVGKQMAHAVAHAVASRRTPTGAFANFDLPKDPK
jgi:hypothetical protein